MNNPSVYVNTTVKHFDTPSQTSFLKTNLARVFFEVGIRGTLNDIFIWHNQADSLTFGMVITASPQYRRFHQDEYGQLVKQEWFVTSGALANIDMYIIEGFALTPEIKVANASEFVSNNKVHRQHNRGIPSTKRSSNRADSTISSDDTLLDFLQRRRRSR